jgi:hypothetical protein
MEHRTFRVIGITLVEHSTLRIRFDDDTEQTIDFTPVLEGEVYGPLGDEKMFQQVEIVVAKSSFHKCSRSLRRSGLVFDDAKVALALATAWMQTAEIAERWRRVELRGQGTLALRSLRGQARLHEHPEQVEGQIRRQVR